MSIGDIIPAPAKVSEEKGFFSLESCTAIHIAASSPGLKRIAGLFSFQVKKDSGICLDISENKITGSLLQFQITGNKNGKEFESYRLVITPEGMEISGTSEAGIFRGTQALRQIIGTANRANLELPCGIIEDYPRFKWRGLNLDCSRHFMTVEFIKKYIDLLALYRMNIFHWHLIDDQGWRLEIKKYPRLTDIGAWRGAGKKRYGGFYTQDEVKEIVEYAAERFITVVPEIELPGHCRSALAAYPYLSCTGKHLDVQGKWGIMKDVYCAGSKETISFLEDILDEVTELFPSEYIHIGGDECIKTRWRSCPRCQQRIAEEGLADENQLQSWFITRFSRFLSQKNKKIIGWDEICEGGIPEGAIVQSWRGMAGAVEAAKKITRQ